MLDEGERWSGGGWEEGLEVLCIEIWNNKEARKVFTLTKMEGLDVGATVHGSLSIGVIGLVLWRDIFSSRDDVESRFLLDTGSEADMLASGHEIDRLKDVYEGIASGGPESRYANT